MNLKIHYDFINDKARRLTGHGLEFNVSDSEYYEIIKELKVELDIRIDEIIMSNVGYVIVDKCTIKNKSQDIKL